MGSALFNEVKDSGQRQEFATGSVRDTAEGKGRHDLVSPLAQIRLARHYENGCRKYGDRNWEKGQPLMRCIDSALRHIYKHIEGQRDEDHLAAAAWNIMAVIHFEEAIERGLLPKSLDDRPNYMPVVAAQDPTPAAPPTPDPAAIPMPPSGSKSGLSAWRSNRSGAVYVKRWLDGLEWFKVTRYPEWCTVDPEALWSAGKWNNWVHNGDVTPCEVPEDFPFAK